jgi:uncharacterized protein (UPF0335 family)
MKGSIQLRRYLSDRRSGVPFDQAALAHGIGLEEARLHDAAEAAGEYADIDLSEPAPIGHNSEDAKMSDTVAAEQLRLFIERIERLEEEKKGMSDDIRDVYAEAKSQGYDAKTMRRIVALRKMETHVRQESEALLSTYASALGLQLAFL